MKRYRATLTAVYEVEAENVAQAWRVANRIRSIGEVIGSRCEANDRDSTQYRVRLVSERLEWETTGRTQ